MKILTTRFAKCLDFFYKVLYYTLVCWVHAVRTKLTVWMEVEKMPKKLHYADYVRFLLAGNTGDLGSSSLKIKIAQTKGSNQVLYDLATISKSENDELIVADLLLSYLIQANKPAFFRWRKCGGSPQRDGDAWREQAWPVRSINLFPYLMKSSYTIYPAEFFSRPDKARKAWMMRFLNTCQTSKAINPAIITLPKVTTPVDITQVEEIQAEFSDLIYTTIATAQIPSDIVANPVLYRFPNRKQKMTSIGFFANRAMLLHFKTAQQTQPRAVEYLSLTKFLRLTGLPSYVDWKCTNLKSHRGSVATWFDQVVSVPFQTYSMFSVELDYDGLQLKVTRLFDTQSELEVDSDEVNDDNN